VTTAFVILHTKSTGLKFNCSTGQKKEIIREIFICEECHSYSSDLTLR
jgi:hypothetical protein